MAVSILVYSVCNSLIASEEGRVSGVQSGVVNTFCISSNCRYNVFTVCTKVNDPYQVPYKLKAASAALLHCFFGFLTTSGSFPTMEAGHLRMTGRCHPCAWGSLSEGVQSIRMVLGYSLLPSLRCCK